MDTTAGSIPIPVTAGTSANPDTSALGPVERLLRDRTGLIDDITEGRGLAVIARAMLLTIAAGAALFGASIGIYRGGVQIGYAAIKLPLILLFTAAISAPALTAFNLALDRPGRLRRDLALALCSLALGALVLAAEAPLILVARALDVGYHETTLLLVACCGLAGLVSLVFLVRGLKVQAGSAPLTAAVLLCAVTTIVGAQAAWTLRPYLVRPRATEVPFIREVEGNLLDAIVETFDSAHGRYRRDSAPLPGETTEATVPDPAADTAAPASELDPEEGAP